MIVNNGGRDFGFHQGAPDDLRNGRMVFLDAGAPLVFLTAGSLFFWPAAPPPPPPPRPKTADGERPLGNRVSFSIRAEQRRLQEQPALQGGCVTHRGDVDIEPGAGLEKRRN